MPISADLIREFVARGERTMLDFKRDDYDWNGRGNVELAKDLMAIGNSLSVGEQGYILTGVDNDGAIVGLTTPHRDDADLHARVRRLLNSTPEQHTLLQLRGGRCRWCVNRRL